MSTDDVNLTRRKLAALVTLVPVAGLVGCSDDKGSAPSSAAPKSDPKPMPEKKPAPEPGKPAMEESTTESQTAASETMESDGGMQEGSADVAMENDGGMSRLDESDSSAVALSYKHNAEELDASKFPTLTANTRCSNCQLYLGGDSPWGGCPIFPGKQVKATGWCTAYTPKVGG